MKKIYLALPLLALAMTACDPSEFDLGSPDATTPASTIEGAITINQVDENGNPAADGNYFTYTTSPSLPVQIYNYNSSGQEVPLAHGAYGSFSIIPKRGEDSNQTFYIRLANHDGSMSEISKTYSVYVPTELPQEIEYLASNSGSKKWIWDTSVNGQAWGNLGYACGSGENFFVNGSDQWWGCGPEMLWYSGEGGQYGHTDGDDAKAGEGDAKAYMIFDEEGNILTYDSSGNKLREGTYEVTDYDGTRHVVGDNPWHLGKLTTSAPAIMYPYMINGGGKLVTEFEILGLTKDQLCLVYPGSAAPGAWAEATYWRFKAVDNEDLIYKDWTWDISMNGQAWGNLGYACGSGENFFVNGSDQWWGCGPEMLWYNGEGGQYGHTDGDDAMSGEGDANAYMTFDEDGKITTYDANGTILRSANFEVNIFSSRQDVGGNPWNIGTLTTTEPAIMYPYMINGGGTKVTDFEILGLTSDQLVLVYPGTAAPGAWAEATFWRFMKK